MNLLKQLDEISHESPTVLSDYRGLMAEWVNFSSSATPDRLQVAAAEATRVVAADRKLAQQASRDYPLDGNEKRAPVLKKEIIQLHRDFIDHIGKGQPGNLPERILQMRQRILTRELKDFRNYSPEVIAKVDAIAAAGCLAELEYLKTQFPVMLKHMTDGIDEFINRVLERLKGKPPPPPPPASRATLSMEAIEASRASREEETPPRWDVRECLLENYGLPKIKR